MGHFDEALDRYEAKQHQLQPESEFHAWYGTFPQDGFWLVQAPTAAHLQVLQDAHARLLAIGWYGDAASLAALSPQGRWYEVASHVQPRPGDKVLQVRQVVTVTTSRGDEGAGWDVLLAADDRVSLRPHGMGGGAPRLGEMKVEELADAAAASVAACEARAASRPPVKRGLLDRLFFSK